MQTKYEYTYLCVYNQLFTVCVEANIFMNLMFGMLILVFSFINIELLKTHMFKRKIFTKCNELGF